MNRQLMGLADQIQRTMIKIFYILVGRERTRQIIRFWANFVHNCMRLCGGLAIYIVWYGRLITLDVKCWMAFVYINF